MIEDLRKTAKADQENDDTLFEQTTHEFNKEREKLEENIEQERNKEKENREGAEAQDARVISLKADIRDLETKLGWNKANEEKMVQKRNTENDSYEEQKQTLNDIIKAVGECIAELNKGTGFITTGKSLEIQAIAAAFMKPKDSAMVGSLIQQAPGGPDAPKARVYDSKTGKVTEIFEKLERDSKDKLNEIDLLEKKSANAHDLAVAALNGEFKSMDMLKNEKDAEKGKAQAMHDDHRKAQNDAKAALADFTNNLRDVTQTYKDDSDRYKLVSKEREDEVESMGFALDVLTSISGVRAGHTALTKDVPIFLQENMSPKEKIALLLHNAGKRLHNSQLQEIAMRVEATTGKRRDVFKQINNMISKLIDQLVEEQRKEDDHKDWCDRELKKTEAADADKTSKLETITTALEKATASQEENIQGRSDAQNKITELQGQREEEKKFRKKDRDNNKVSIDDAKKAQKGIQQALQILQKWAAQRDTSTTKTAGNEKVVKMLEDAETHYSQMQADVEGAEQTAQVDHQKSLNNIKRTISTLDAQIVGHDDTLGRLSQKISTLNGKQKHTKDALFEIKQYMGDLTPACIKEKGAYEKRRDARAQERDALREARETLKTAFDGLDGPNFMEIKAHKYIA